MDLANDDGGVFDAFIIYIYQDCLPSLPNEKFQANRKGAGDFMEGILFGLFVFADKLCMNRLANRVLDLIQDLGSEYMLSPYLGIVSKIYRITPPKSKLRTYSVLMCLYQVHGATIDPNGPDVPDTPAQDKEDQECEEEDLTSVVTEHIEYGVDYMMLHHEHTLRFSSDDPPHANDRNIEEEFGGCFFHTRGKGEQCHLGAEDEEVKSEEGSEKPETPSA